MRHSRPPPSSSTDPLQPQLKRQRLADLRRRGVTLALAPWPRGVIVSPPDAPATTGDLEAIAEHRGDLIGILRAEAKPTPTPRKSAHVVSHRHR